jgi:Zn-dependent peptidase ImmA (M78 family)
MTKRKKPSKCKISPYSYTIKYVNMQGEDDHGKTLIDMKEIYLNKDTIEQVQQETMLHECLHALLEDCTALKNDYKDVDEREEDLIRYLSPRLLSFLRDNPSILKYIL